eukprot:PhF_6_TR27368/c0_g1_i1/m.40260
MSSNTVGIASTLEVDGIVTSVYDLVWRRKTGTMGLDSEVRIATTVIYENNFPRVWYIYNERKGMLERRIGEEVTPQGIVHDFLKSRNQAARLHNNLDDSTDLCAQYFCSVKDPIDGENVTRVEFLDNRGLNELVNQRCRRPDGFLQKWVPSQGKYNTVVQAVWTPHHCHVEKRQNIHAMRDKRFNAYDRAVTYEGPTHMSKEAFVAPHIRWQIRVFCQDIVDHIYSVEHIAVAGMVMHFKVDPNCAIWFLWCSSMRLQRAVLNLTPHYVPKEHIVGEIDEDTVEAERLERLLRSRNIHGTDVGLSTSTSTTILPPSPQAMKKGNKPTQVRRVMGQTDSLYAFKPVPPPSMGPIGDTYTEVPNWSIRNEKKLKTPVTSKDYWTGLPATVARRLAMKKEENRETISNRSRVGSVDGANFGNRVASFRKARGSFLLVQFARHITAHPEEINSVRVPVDKRLAENSWNCVRLAYRTGFLKAMRAEVVVSEWLAELIEVAAASISFPLDILIPKIVETNLGLDWLSQVFEVKIDDETVEEEEALESRRVSIEAIKLSSMLHVHVFLLKKLVLRVEHKRKSAHLWYKICMFLQRRTLSHSMSL